jgi:hypothetical protein
MSNTSTSKVFPLKRLIISGALSSALLGFNGFIANTPVTHAQTTTNHSIAMAYRHNSPHPITHIPIYPGGYGNAQGGNTQGGGG